MLHKNGSVIVLNFDVEKNTKPLLNPNHFKFVLVDPEGDLSHAEAAFKKVRISRAKIVLIIIKKPISLFVDYVLSSYWKIRCINVILVYESDGKIEVVTHNPYLPSKSKFVNLTANKFTQDLFYDKTRNLYGTKIKCLLTFADRTKIKKVQNSGNIYYEGKDYQAMQTILSHLNGQLQVETLDNVLFNPWFESIHITNRTGRKIAILKQRDISILIKSERFTTDDEVLDNLYPHTQNDLSSLAPKSSQISVSNSMITIYKPSMWIINMVTPVAFFLFVLIIRKLFGNTLNIQELYFNVWRISIVNNVLRFPRNSLERSLYFSWLIYCFITNMYLQSKITSILAFRNDYPDIDTIEKLFISGLPLYSIPIYINEVEKKYSGTEFEVYAKSLIPLSSNEGFMDQMIYRSDVSKIPAFLTEHDIAVFVSRCKYARKNGAQMYHLVQESLIPNYQSYKVVHNSPLLPILNKKLRRLEEGGFIDLWANRAIYNATLEGFLYPEHYDENYKSTAKPLSPHVSEL
ncbi:hypothetical protein BDFB_012051, partial [Asbolus verrucosus]